MDFLSQVTFVLLLGSVIVSSSNIYVVNKCNNGNPVVLRGAYGVVIAQGFIKQGETWTHEIDQHNCASCNIATNTGGTLLAEFAHTGEQIWWNLSTDAGYQNPPMRFYSTQPNGPNMYCGDPRCPDGTPGDSHINVVSSRYDLVVEYCG